MIQEYQIRGERILKALKDFSSAKVIQEVTNVGNIHLLSIK